MTKDERKAFPCTFQCAYRPIAYWPKFGAPADRETFEKIGDGHKTLH